MSLSRISQHQMCITPVNLVYLSASRSLSESNPNHTIVHNTLYTYSYREIAKTSKNVERANKTRERSIMPKSWARSFSGYRFFPDLSLSESETTCINLHLKRFSAKCTEDSSRYLHFKQKIFGKSAWHFRPNLPRCTCMRAVNRQPLFTARGTRRAFSVALHASSSISRVWRWSNDS